MKNVRLFAALIFFSGTLSISAVAQGASKAPSKAAASPSQAVLERWNEVGGKLIAMAEDFPEEKYDFKPAASVQSFAERLVHSAQAVQIFADTTLGRKASMENEGNHPKSKAEVVAFVKKSFADGASAIQAKGDEGLSSIVVAPFSHEQTRLGDLAYDFIEHSAEIYGQLTVYYRVAGMVPPASRDKKR
ncbi:MAG: DinB family protein [Acidobacteriales bacterium]|nr:DinB family protein [Terriglobales bacterium]